MNQKLQDILMERLDAAESSAYGLEFPKTRRFDGDSIMIWLSDNFIRVVNANVLTIDIVKEYQEDFAKRGILYNQPLGRNQKGFFDTQEFITVDENAKAVVVDGQITAVKYAQVVALGKSVVKSFDNSEVALHGTSVCVAKGKSIVWANGSSRVICNKKNKVVGRDNALIIAVDCQDVTVYDNCIVISNDSEIIAYNDCIVIATKKSIVAGYNNTRMIGFDKSRLISFGQTFITADDKVSVDMSTEHRCQFFLLSENISKSWFDG